jgi:hypothetical protein
VQKLRSTIRRKDTIGEANPLTGLLFCYDCGSKLFNKRKRGPIVHKDVRNGKTYLSKPPDTYHCAAYNKEINKFKNYCSAHHISTSAVREIILDVLKRTSAYVRENEQDFITQVRTFSSAKQAEIISGHDKKIARNEKRLVEINRLFKNLYEDKVKGVISKDIFLQMSADYESEKAVLNKENEALQLELTALKSNADNAGKFVDLVRKYTNFEELTNAMLNEFIDKIYVHEATWSEGINPATNRPLGERTQQVDVHLRYIGKFDIPNKRTPEKIEAEIKAEERRIRAANSKRNYMRRQYDKAKARMAEEAKA